MWCHPIDRRVSVNYFCIINQKVELVFCWISLCMYETNCVSTSRVIFYGLISSSYACLMDD